IGLRTTGMEFASEMIIQAAQAHLAIAETPITYAARPEGSRSKLRSVPDGLRRHGRRRARLGRRDAGAGGAHGARIPPAALRPAAPVGARRLAASPGGARRRRARRRDHHRCGGGTARPAPAPGDVHADPPPPPVTRTGSIALARG